ncbi:hypothetical protein [Nitrosospira lacus]|nr:hypothetical protein [Nitrosospira lacus]
MKKIRLMCLALILLGAFPATTVWANGRGHHHGGGFGWGLGLGLLGGYGLGYYGRIPYLPYYGYPPAYRFAPYGYGYGYGPGYGYGYGPGYGYAPYGYGYPPVMTVPSAPPVYIQQQPQVIQTQPIAPPAQANYWHYCRKPEGYYPYIKNCPDGWLQVAPQPAQ